MSSRNTLVRSLHDVGAGVWLGGSLMGAVALNGAASDAREPRDRARIAADGWARWSPVNAAAIGAHLLGGLGIVLANRGRVKNQSGVTVNTTVKTLVTVAAVGVTAYSGILGTRIAAEGRVDADAATTPGAGTPGGVAEAQHQLQILQWVTPVLTGIIVVMGAQQGEQQRASQVVAGYAKKFRNQLA